jgi:hypothetical protein
MHVSNYMNDTPQMPMGDLPANENELTVPTEEMVTRRAREIALIDERDPNKFTEEDWEQARTELTGVETSITEKDPLDMADSLSGRGSIPGETGSRAPRVAPPDEALLDARLANRGVEEAAHDQMVDAAGEDQSQEG